MSARDIVGLTCKELVELVTDYKCDALDTANRVTFEQHLFGCTWCMTYLKQAERAIELTAKLRPVEPAGPVQASSVETQKLANLFRAWKQSK